MTEEMLGQGIIQSSHSPWPCPIVLVAKKDGTRLYKFAVMTFMATFQRLMEIELVGLAWDTCMAYLENILVPENHIVEALQPSSGV